MDRKDIERRISSISRLTGMVNSLHSANEKASRLKADPSVFRMQEAFARTQNAVDSLIRGEPIPVRTVGSSFFMNYYSNFNLVMGPGLPFYLNNAEWFGIFFDFFNNTNNIVPHKESPLIALDFDLSEYAGGKLVEEEPEQKRIIILNESERIRQIILDIYQDNSQLLRLAPRQFEEVIAELLRQQGFEVELTKQTRDGGYDILALKDIANQARMKWLVECKRYTTQNVGVEIVRSFREVIITEQANRGIIATTSYFTEDAKRKKEKDAPYLLDFRDKDDVLDWVIKYGAAVISR